MWAFRCIEIPPTKTMTLPWVGRLEAGHPLIKLTKNAGRWLYDVYVVYGGWYQIQFSPTNPNEFPWKVIHLVPSTQPGNSMSMVDAEPARCGWSILCSWPCRIPCRRDAWHNLGGKEVGGLWMLMSWDAGNNGDLMLFWWWCTVVCTSKTPLKNQ